MISINKYLINNKTLWHWSVLVLFTGYLFTLIIYGGQLHFLAFDNLDSNVVWFKLLAESGKIFTSNDTIIPNMMGGLPRSCYGSEFNLILWLYYFFTPIQAYVINEVIIHTVAFISMYIFLDRYLFKEDKKYKYIYVNIAALYFAILPFWPSGGLSVPLMPLVIYVLFNIKENKDTWKDWALLIFLPLYSDFVLVYFFFFLLAGIYYLFLVFKSQKLNGKLLIALLFAVSLFLIKDYRLIVQMFTDNGFISNRVEYFSLINKSFWEAYRSAHLEFLNGVPHGKGIHFTILIPTVFSTLGLTLFRNKLSTYASIVFVLLFASLFLFDFWSIILTQKYSLPLITLAIIILLFFQKYGRLLSILLLVQIAIAYWYGFSFYKGWNSLFEFFPKMEMFNFSRFFFISQMLWAIIAALTIRLILKQLSFSALFVTLFMILQFYVAIHAAFFSLSPKLYYLPFNKYYAINQFTAIKEYIGKPQDTYRVISLGIEPAVSLYNGFYTLDGYSVNYPLTYKHEFRKIISTHLEKNQTDRKLFDGWGSKVYVFDNQVGYSYKNEDDIHTNKKPYIDLDINTTQIYNMGGRYLFSSRQIVNTHMIDLHFEKVFDNKDNTLWTIWLYSIVKPPNKNER